jgi:hypothetical protein
MTKTRSRASRWRSHPDTGSDVRGGIRRKKTARGYRYVSDKRSTKGNSNRWIAAVRRAREELGLKGFHTIKRAGQHCDECKDFYSTCRNIYDSVVFE